MLGRAKINLHSRLNMTTEMLPLNYLLTVETMDHPTKKVMRKLKLFICTEIVSKIVSEAPDA